MQQSTYPVQFSVDYPDRPLNRLTTFFRFFVAIPILIVLGTVSGGSWQWTSGGKIPMVAAGTGGLLFLAPPANDRIPAEVPPMVVRLEPRAAAVRQPSECLSGPSGRPVPIHHR